MTGVGAAIIGEGIAVIVTPVRAIAATMMAGGILWQPLVQVRSLAVQLPTNLAGSHRHAAVRMCNGVMTNIVRTGHGTIVISPMAARARSVIHPIIDRGADERRLFGAAFSFVFPLRNASSTIAFVEYGPCPPHMRMTAGK